MRKFYFFVLSFFFLTSLNAQPNVVVVNKGNWKERNTWSLKKVPQNGDAVNVPKGFTVVIDGNIKAQDLHINIEIYGELELLNGKLELGYNSRITLFEGGKIVTGKKNDADKIIIGDVAKYTGREGVLSGPLVASRTTSIAPMGFMKSEPIILPVKFAGFSVSSRNGDVLVQWSTAEEVNAAYFEVERSYDGASWAAIGRVAAAGHTTQLNQYSYTDKSAMGTTLYYRIRQVDHDGKAMHTIVQSLKKAISGGVTIIAAQQKVAVQFAQPVKGRVELQLVSVSGHVISRQVVDSAAGLVVLQSATALKGHYFITVSNGQDVHASQQVVL